MLPEDSERHLARFSGLRPSEEVALLVQDFNAVRRTVTVNKARVAGLDNDSTKTGEARRVELCPRALLVLRRQLALRGRLQHEGRIQHDHLFFKENGEPIRNLLYPYVRWRQTLQRLQDRSRRGAEDTHYPDSSRYKDFQVNPRWCTHTVVDLDPRGLVLTLHEYFAYRDPSRGEWDMSEALNLAVRHEVDDLERRRKEHELRERIESFWHFIPHAHRATYVCNGLVRFEDIAVIDDKGDSEFRLPHIFVDFHDTKGPCSGFARYLRIHERRHESIEGLKRIDHFPSKYVAPRIGTVHSNRLKVAMAAARFVSVGNESMRTLYAVDDRFDFLAVADVIGIEGTEGKLGTPGEPILIQITHKLTMPGKVFLESPKGDPTLTYESRQQIGREVAENDQLRILEFKPIYQWAIDRARSATSA